MNDKEFIKKVKECKEHYMGTFQYTDKEFVVDIFEIIVQYDTNKKGGKK